ncbi:MAG TPA: hypothetical protein VLA93_06560 [Pyrinomonadaceae bacterium]|nr:hypothetical protein [Pyrinomonadaceae bacterium]
MFLIAGSALTRFGGTTLTHGRVKLLATGLFKARPWHRITALKRLN